MRSGEHGMNGAERRRSRTACDRKGVAHMTVLHTHDGTDFSLVCDGCGLVVDHLGASLHSWTLAWSLFSRHGWIGAQAPGGPHGCPRCVRLAERSAIDEESERDLSPLLWSTPGASSVAPRK